MCAFVCYFTASRRRLQSRSSAGRNFLSKIPLRTCKKPRGMINFLCFFIGGQHCGVYQAGHKDNKGRRNMLHALPSPVRLSGAGDGGHICVAVVLQRDKSCRVPRRVRTNLRSDIHVPQRLRHLPLLSEKRGLLRTRCAAHQEPLQDLLDGLFRVSACDRVQKLLFPALTASIRYYLQLSWAELYIQ